jgi:hypothetical protein
MSQARKISFIAAVAAAVLGSMISDASANRRLYPLTSCGPQLEYLCPIHGYFDAPPFHYNLAIYPGCLQVRIVETPYGLQRRHVLVCGT